jgi:hypothetical protein
MIVAAAIINVFHLLFLCCGFIILCAATLFTSDAGGVFGAGTEVTVSEKFTLAVDACMSSRTFIISSFFIHLKDDNLA